CPSCGYLHPAPDGNGPDLCERCGSALPAPMRKLFRMQNVTTRRRDRISSDEEERQRQGYELQTAIRFAETGHELGIQTAEALDADTKLAVLEYGHASSIWRINRGWKRRKRATEVGFVLDVERGYWAKDAQAD